MKRRETFEETAEKTGDYQTSHEHFGDEQNGPAGSLAASRRATTASPAPFRDELPSHRPRSGSGDSEEADDRKKSYVQIGEGLKPGAHEDSASHSNVA